MTVEDILQWAGCITGVLGAGLLAFNNTRSGLGFVLFLFSSGFWMAFGIKTNAPGLVATQIFFIATSVFGIYRWLIASKMEKKSRAV